MGRIMLAPVRTFNIFTDFFSEIGAPVERELENHRLPLDLSGEIDSYVPIHMTLNFLQRMQELEQIDDLAFRGLEGVHRRASQHRRIVSPFLQSTAFSSLTRIYALGHSINPDVDCRMVNDGKALKLCVRAPSHYGCFAKQFYEWTILLQQLEILKNFAVDDAIPFELGFSSNHQPCECLRSRYPNVRVIQNKSFSYAAFDIETGLRLFASTLQGTNIHQIGKTDKLVEDGKDLTFSESLLLSLRAYLFDGYPDIKLAADLTNLNVRTLQRQLKREGTTYSELVDRSRLDIARELLTKPDYKIIDVSQSVGYDDPSHFTRFFRRVTGINPLKYRQVTSEH